MGVYTTEIASDELMADNPIHQRLLKPYYWAKDIVSGVVLELGCGEGRGVDIIGPITDQFTGIDKIGAVIDGLKQRYQEYDFIETVFPPLSELEDNTYDFIISFQVRYFT